MKNTRVWFELERVVYLLLFIIHYCVRLLVRLNYGKSSEYSTAIRTLRYTPTTLVLRGYIIIYKVHNNSATICRNHIGDINHVGPDILQVLILAFHAVITSAAKWRRQPRLYETLYDTRSPPTKQVPMSFQNIDK